MMPPLWEPQLQQEIRYQTAIKGQVILALNTLIAGARQCLILSLVRSQERGLFARNTRFGRRFDLQI